MFSQIKNLISVEYLLRVAAWLLFVASEYVAIEILKFTHNFLDYYGVTIALAALLVIAVRQLGNTPLIRDLEEICLLDVIVQCYGMATNLTGFSDSSFLVFAYTIMLLKFIRLSWWAKNDAGEILPAWPPFGLIAVFSKSHSQVIYPTKQRQFAYLGIFSAGVVAWMAWYFLGGVPYVAIHVISIFALIKLTKMIAADIQTREDQRLEKTAEIAALEARTKMDADIKERNEELCHATHDVKGPLDAMIDLVNELKACTDVETAHVAALHVQTGLHELGDKLDEIIAMARITTKKMTATDEIISIEALRYHFRDQFKPMADRRDIVMGVDDGEFWVKSNQYLLYRIIGNLMMNAIVHGKPKTKVRLAIHCSSQFCYIRICDTGPGIPNAAGPDRAANFANVAMANRSNAALSKALGVTALSGHGLGLRGVMRMSKTLGMPITLVSRPGKGTIVRLKVPLATPEDIAHKRKESAALFAEPRE